MELIVECNKDKIKLESAPNTTIFRHGGNLYMKIYQGDDTVGIPCVILRQVSSTQIGICAFLAKETLITPLESRLIVKE